MKGPSTNKIETHNCHSVAKTRDTIILNFIIVNIYSTVNIQITLTSTSQCTGNW